jgi:predicted HicB family RNase H-like nuclease
MEFDEGNGELLEPNSIMSNDDHENNEQMGVNDLDDNEQFNYNNDSFNISDDDINNNEEDSSDDESDEDLKRSSQMIGGGADDVEELDFRNYFAEISEQQQKIFDNPKKSNYSSTFNIWTEYSVHFALQIKYNAESKSNNDKSFYLGSKVTTKDAILMIRNYSAKHKHTISAELDLLVLTYL